MAKRKPLPRGIRLFTINNPDGSVYKRGSISFPSKDETSIEEFIAGLYGCDPVLVTTECEYPSS